MKKETLEEVKDLTYWKNNAEEDYLKVPISVLRYISELENKMYSEEDMKLAFVTGALTDLFNTWNISDEDMAKEKFDKWFEQFKKK